jgi:hypothetical protein
LLRFQLRVTTGDKFADYPGPTGGRVVTHQLCAWLLCRLNIGCTFGEKFACYERVEGFRA